MLLPTRFIEPCLPSTAERPPSGPNWIHEIKHDGYRLMACRNAAGVRLLTRNGKDLRREPIEQRKGALAKLLRGAKLGLQLNEHIAEPGDVVFRHACRLGLEGIVSKRLGSHYVSGRSRYWLKFKNPNAPAVKREAEEDWGKER